LIIIHLVDDQSWEKIKHQPNLLSDAFEEVGFIHCCLPGQVEHVLRQWFPGRKDMLALEIETEQLTSPVVFENLEGGKEVFPHIYGLVNRNAVLKWYPLSNDNRSKHMGIELKEIPFYKFNTKIFDLWDKTWLLLTSGDFHKGDFNSMTVAWGSLGIMWKMPFAMVVVRPTRYTFGLINKYDTFSLCAFPEKYRQALNLLGTQSGRDGDKINASGLTPIGLETISAPGYVEADLIMQCRKIYSEDFNPKKFNDPDIDKNYPGKDYHRMVFGEILRIKGENGKYFEK